ncbi:MAG TPA: hypothetical protein VG722_05535, partial [Tepidisphaeraceae bacterium]|nr:hypothetical protein [Tepidisphaeraceae bacterium]
MIFPAGDILWGATGRPAWIGVFVLCVALTVFTLWNYRDQGPAVPRLWRILMIAFRCIALLAICFSILQPTAVRPESPDETGGVGVLIDYSHSMAAIDTGNNSGEQVATADALNLIPSHTRSHQWLDLRQRVERVLPLLEETRRAAADLRYARLVDQSVRSQELRLDESAARLRAACLGLSEQPITKSLADLTRGINQPNWSEQAQKEVEGVLNRLAQAQQTSDEKLYQENPVVRADCKKLSAMSRLERTRLAVDNVIAQLPESVPVYAAYFDSSLKPISLRMGGQFAWPSSLDDSGKGSNITGAVHELLQRMGSTRLRAIFLFTDGRQVGGSLGPPIPVAAPPIFPVLTAGRVRDISLTHITGPVRTYLHEPASIDVRVQGTNMEEMPLKLHLQCGNLTQIQSLSLDRNGIGLATFSVPMQQAGNQVVRVSAEHFPGEASEKNNALTTRVDVASSRLNVAMLGGFPSREVEFLGEYLCQTPWINPIIRFGDQRIETPQLSQQSVIILDDLGVTRLGKDQWEKIREVVRQGGGLILIAGGHHLPADYSNNPELSDLLPFAPGGQPVWRTWAGQDAFFHFAPVEPNEPLLRLENNDMMENRQWSELPAMYHYLQMPPLKPDVQPLLIEQESASPVLTENTLGKGHVVLVGFNETWRWRRIDTGIPR